jgi:hypothetical protein
MAKRYAYTYTKTELNRRRWIGVVLGFPALVFAFWAMFGFLLNIKNSTVALVLAIVLSALVNYLMWRFSSHQIDTKFHELD